jgi:hypothetical protein
MDDRLPTETWVKAHLRRCHAEAIPVMVLRKGDRTGGTVLLKLLQRGAGCRVLAQMRDMEGRLGWLSALGPALVAEDAADAYIERAVARDPDLWVIEVETRDGSHPFEGRML